jgi:2-(1,2-epoxy-1,2-dihydrophenyl)acetyl-CoA isomerase
MRAEPSEVGILDETILSEVEDGVGVITLNRPEKLNAMQAPMMDLLLQTARRMAADPKVGCVVLTGAGRGFCAGGDMTAKAAELAAEALRQPARRKRPQTIASKVDWLEASSQTSIVLHDMPKPTIAMINGACAGAGLSLAGACDLRFAGSSALLTSAFVKARVSGDMGGAYFWTKILGAGKARELYLLSERIGAERALAMGLVNRVVPDDQLRAETMAVARELASTPRHIFGLMKRTLALAETAHLLEVVRAESTHQIMANYCAAELRQLADDAERLSAS